MDPREEDITKMLAAGVHIGTTNSDPKMADYIWKRRVDGVHIINLGRTYDKLMMAARMIVAIEHPQDVIAISARPYGQRAVLKFAQHTGAQYIAGRYTPGTFTNQITKQFKEPRLLIVTDPRTDHQPVKESSFVNVPVIAFCDSDSPLNHVDLAIPANNKGRNSIGLLYWLLAREVLCLRGSIPRATEWGVSVDLFFFREPDEVEQAKVEQEEAAPAFTENVADPYQSLTNADVAPAADPVAFEQPAPAVAENGGWDDAPPAVAVEEQYVDPAAAAGWDAAAPGPTDAANAGW
jgi:small subunit ribosomal protein SAe